MKKIVLALFILLLAYAATGWFLAPRFADKALREFSSGRLGLELQYENLLLYPFGFSAHLENLVVLDREGQPLFTASAVEAKTGPLGFWTQSAQFGSLIFENPELRVGDSETGRGQVVEFLARLSALLASPDDTVRIDVLHLREARIVSSGRNGVLLLPMTPSFDLLVESLGPARSGPFQLAFDTGDGSPVQVGGDMTWQPTGSKGTIRFSAPDRQPPLQAASGPVAGGNHWAGLSIDAPFSLDVTPQGLSVQIQQARLVAATLEFGLHPLAAVRMDQGSADFGLKLDFGPPGLILREASARLGKSTVTGLMADSPGWVEMAVARSEITLSEYTLRQGQAIPFDMRLSTEPGGEIGLSGQYGPEGRTGAMVLDLKAVPVSALFQPGSGFLPAAIAGELLTARGRLQLSEPFASIALSGGFASGAKLSFSGMSQFENPLQDSRFELGLTGLDAHRASPWLETFAGRGIRSGTLGAHLAVRSADGQVAGRYELSIGDLQLQPAAPGISGRAGDPDLLLALLQDSQEHIGFAVPLDGQSRGAGTGFADWLGQETSRYLSGLGRQPFDTLAQMVGTEAGMLESVSFEAGQAGLTPRAMAQLEWLKTALQWRPGLALRVSGGYDPEADRYALASQQILLHVNLATAVGADERANPAPVDFGDPKVQSVLDEFAGSRLGRERVEAIWRNFQLTEEGADASLAATDNIAFYQALFDELVENEQISERALLSLARFRARTVIDQLARNSIDRERLEDREPEAVRSKVGSGVPTRFELHLNQPAIDPAIEQPPSSLELAPF